MQTGGCGRKTTSSFRYFDVVLVKWKTSPCQVSVLAGQCVFFTADIPLFNSNTTNFAFCAFKGVEELVERIASMERGGADTTPLISRRFAFSFVLHATRHSKCSDLPLVL